MPTLIYLLYRILLLAALPLIVLYVAVRGLRNRGYFRGLGERLGFLPGSYQRTVPGAVWLHAVSVGEVLSAAELIRRIKSEMGGVPVFLSTTTLAGRAAADEKLASVADGIFYFPFDYVSCVRRVLRRIRPSLVVIMETEIWPNLFRETKRSGAGLLIVNGRISKRALGRYRAFKWFFGPVLLQPGRILVQSEQDRERYIEAGAPAAAVHIGGNLKYDFNPQKAVIPQPVERFLERVSPSLVWIAASTTAPAQPGDPDEDDAVVSAFRELAPEFPGLLLILAPRQPDRFDVVAQKLKGLSWQRRWTLEPDATLTLPGVLLLDTIGELGSLYRKADAVFMGGTLPHRGGHNILEPALFGCAIVAGPHRENFTEIAAEFTAADCLVRIQDGAELASATASLLRDQSSRQRIGRRALELAESKRGATARAIEEIRKLHGLALVSGVRSPVSRVLLWPLAQLWAAGNQLRHLRDQTRRRSLSTPVVSVGGITMGGVGKTPFVLWLAAKLKDAGERPAILTRGYRRRSPEKLTVIPLGASAPAAVTGDEAQMFVRAALGPVGIAAERYDAGVAIESRFHPSLFLLDDGFQHERLARNVDIVLIDSMDQFSGGRVFPEGRLREPLSALARADAFVLTRTEAGREYAAIERTLRVQNPQAPIFRARVRPVQWESAKGNWDPGKLPFQITAAFCGLANPASFWRTIEGLGFGAALKFPFGDHHTYRPMELMRLASQARSVGAEALLTTEKDAMNLPPEAAELVAPLALCWLRVGIEVEPEQELLEFVLGRVRPCASSGT